MNETKKEQFDLAVLVEKIVTTPAPDSLEEIAKLLSNLPVKSWIHRQLPTKEQDMAFEMMKEKSLSPTPEEIKFIADVCCGKYHRIRRGNWNWPQFDKGKELYQQFYDLTNCEEVKYILDNFDQFKNLCYESIDNRQREDDLAPYRNTGPSTSRDPDSEEWRKG